MPVTSSPERLPAGDVTRAALLALVPALGPVSARLADDLTHLETPWEGHP